jgi:hypothetical protein
MINDPLLQFECLLNASDDPEPIINPVTMNIECKKHTTESASIMEFTAYGHGMVFLQQCFGGNSDLGCFQPGHQYSTSTIGKSWYPQRFVELVGTVVFRDLVSCGGYGQKPVSNNLRM